MSSLLEANRTEDLESRAQIIAKNIAESLRPHLERIIRQHITSSTLDLQVVDPEIHLDASLVGRRDDRIIAQKIHIEPLKLHNIHRPATPNALASATESYPSPVSSTPRDLRSELPDSNGTSTTQPEPPEDDARRPVGGLRLRGSEGSSNDSSCRQLQSDGRSFPKRRKINEERSAMKPSTLDKLVTSIWEQLHGSLQLDPQVVSEQWTEQRMISADSSALVSPSSHHFSRVNLLCRKVTQASRCCRSLEVIVQAHWISCYDARVRFLAEEDPHVSVPKHKVAVLKEACEDFGWTEKDLRNKMAVWRGYHEIGQAGGWVPLVFAGMGLYRYCKYRVDFTPEALSKLRGMKSAFEVAADTLHPQWRQLLSIVDESTTRLYTGHQHDWVVQEGGAIPLRETYLQWDAEFSYEHLEDSAIDDIWGDYDPRATPSRANVLVRENCKCENCDGIQSEQSFENTCTCFPQLYGGRKAPVPVQVFRTAVGKNNGLKALCSFPRGAAIGEFVGVITSAINNLDCMQSSVDDGPIYQIYQGRRGNFTRFINHSCLPNSQYERFTWLGLQRIVLVSKGIDAGQEITVDYGDGYWQNLDKICRCGETCCRYKNRRILNADR